MVLRGVALLVLGRGFPGAPLRLLDPWTSAHFVNDMLFCRAWICPKPPYVPMRLLNTMSTSAMVYSKLDWRICMFVLILCRLTDVNVLPRTTTYAVQG